MDSEKEEMNQADIAALHHFYSRHISDLPNDQALTELFTQVHKCITVAHCGSQEGLNNPASVFGLAISHLYCFFNNLLWRKINLK